MKKLDVFPCIKPSKLVDTEGTDKHLVLLEMGEQRMKKVVLAFLIGCVVTYVAGAYTEQVETSLAQGVIRLHVIANSDSDADQQLKYKVRDRIIAETGTLFADSDTLEQSRVEICKNLDRIRQIAQAEVAANGYDYPVTVEFGDSDFPTKVYGNVTLPAGTYEALKVKIGSAEGQNWWCVLFPPLCFVDEATAEMPEESEQQLKNSMGEPEYEMVTQTDELPVEVRFKAYEMWQAGRMRLRAMFARLN